MVRVCEGQMRGRRVNEVVTCWRRRREAVWSPLQPRAPPGRSVRPSCRAPRQPLNLTVSCDLVYLIYFLNTILISARVEIPTVTRR